MVMIQPQNGWVVGQGGFRLVPILGILLMVQKSGQPVDVGAQVVLFGGLGWLVFSRLIQTFTQLKNIPFGRDF